MLTNRQSYLDYSGYTQKTTSNTSKTPTETPTKSSLQRENSDSQENSQRKQSKSPPNKIFKKARKNSADYKINPDVIPRPRHIEEFYKNPSNKSYIFDTNEDSLPPNTTSNFIVKETSNSSPRLIRSSMIKLPLDQDILNKSNLVFGLNVQPFAELLEGDTAIPRIEVTDDILRCSRCSTYINNKFEMKFVGNNKRVAICNCCQYHIELITSNTKVKSEYLATDISFVPELSCPTIDFVAPPKFLPKYSFSPSYGIFIDISQQSLDVGFASYVRRKIIID
jgi:protein transport protein SEC24